MNDNVFYVYIGYVFCIKPDCELLQFWQEEGDDELLTATVRVSKIYNPSQDCKMCIA